VITVQKQTKTPLYFNYLFWVEKLVEMQVCFPPRPNGTGRGRPKALKFVIICSPPLLI
jgi:hypothetical protein